MFGDVGDMIIEECPRCRHDHLVGDVRGKQCGACEIEDVVRAKGASEAVVQEARNSVLNTQFSEIMKYIEQKNA